MPLIHPSNVNEPVLNQFSLRRKVAVVTGGAGGIGVEIVRGLAEAGADVALIYHNSSRAQDVAAQISKDTAVRVEAFRADVTCRSEIRNAIQHIADDFGRGRLDIVVANSGICANVPALDYTEDQWSKNSAVNYDGVMWTAQAAGAIFKQQGWGSLIITASVSATLVNIPQTQAAYNSSKAAVVHLAKSLAVEWSDFARVNCISPGFILTEMITKQPEERMSRWLSMIPGRRICHPAELKAAFVFLASDACCYMTGANLIIDGGYTLP